MLLTISEFIGHLHPALVHLPIGILLIGLFIQWLARKPKYAAARSIVPTILLCGAIAATLSCITGYILSRSGDYDADTVGYHQWMGISVAVIAFVSYAREKNKLVKISSSLISTILLILVFITGHIGGTLTHGSDYLSGPLENAFGSDSVISAEIKPVPNVQEAFIYADIVQPIFRTKCYGCHSTKKQKGGLRLNDSLGIFKGGKDGVVITRGKADESDLIKRLVTEDKDKHMPPKEKPQLTQGQVAILHWWIDNGAPIDRKVKAVPQPDKMKPILVALQKTEVKPIRFENIPNEAVQKADFATIEKLAKRNVVVLPVAANSNYVMANFITDSLISDEDLKMLASLKSQLIWLKLGFTSLDDKKLAVVAQLTNLRELSVEHTQVTDAGLAQIRSLKNLRYLNIVGTKITARGLAGIKDLKSLKNIYLYQSGVQPSDWNELKKNFPGAKLDSGGYTLPLLPGDTSMLKY